MVGSRRMSLAQTRAGSAVRNGATCVSGGCRERLHASFARSAAIEAVAAWMLGSCILLVPTSFSGPFEMSGPGAVVLLSLFFFVTLLRTTFWRRRRSVGFLIGFLLSTLWYPVAYSAIEDAASGGRGPADPSFYLGILSALAAPAVFRSVLDLTSVSLTGALLGYFLAAWSPGSRAVP